MPRLSSAQLACELVYESVDSGRIPGALFAVLEPDGTTQVWHRGAAQRVPVNRAMQADLWFDLASLTKVLFTTPRILEHAHKGAIDLDAPLTTVLPDLRQYDNDCWERQVTFRQCLGHQTPFPAVEPLYTYGQSSQLLRAFVLQRQWKAGDATYSDINFILLGLALERLESCTLREMDPGPGFAFSAPAQNAVATEDCTWRQKVMCGEVHDDNCYALQGAGHAGLFGTASSVLAYAKSLLFPGSVGPTAHSKTVLKLIQTPLSDTYNHGWQRAHTGWSGGERCSAQTIGHTGFTGTGLWIDFKAQRAWTLLTNSIHPTRHSNSGINELRRSVSNAVCD